MLTTEFRTLANSYHDVKDIKAPMIVKTTGAGVDNAADDAAADEVGPGGRGRHDDRRRHHRRRDEARRRAEGAQGPAGTAEKDQQVKVESLDDLVEFFIAAGKKGIAVNRYKGLGEMNPDTLWETTMDPAKRTLLQVKAEDHPAADLMFTDADGRPGRAAPQVHRRQRARREEPRHLTVATAERPEPHIDRRPLQSSPRQHRRRDEALVHGLRDERDHRARAARRARRPEAGAPPRALRDARRWASRAIAPTASARKIVGEVMGNYHPHGDASIYDTLVRLAQEFSMRYPLVDGQGNFGSVDGDPPAAMRYTEARLEAMAEAMMADIDKETVDFVPNYDETTEEPTVLPTTFPNLLVNGSAGIAVGMATNIPPHNLREVIDGCIAAIEQRGQPREARLKAVLRVVTGPDFPTGGFIVGRDGICQALHDRPRARSLMRAQVVDRGERRRATRQSIVITEIPYQVNKARLIEKIAELRQREEHRGHLATCATNPIATACASSSS